MRKLKFLNLTAFIGLLLLSACGAHNGNYVDPAYYESMPANPGEWTQEEYSKITENPFLGTADNPFSTFSIDVDAAAYANMRRFIQGGQMPPADAIRTEELINYFHYDYPQPLGNHPFSVTTEYSSCPWNVQHQLVLIGLQGKEIAKAALPPSNLVFLIDVSGSMEAANKLPLLKKAFSRLVEELRPQDKVAIVTYAGAAGLVLAPTSGNEKYEILNALDRLNAGGSTAGGAGIELAYKVAQDNFLADGNNRVILATDGDFNVGPSGNGELETLIAAKSETGIFLSILGFGIGNYKDSQMQTLAEKGNGNHAYIDNEKEAEKVLVNEFGGTLFTIAKDVKLQVEFNPAKVKGYRLIGYESRIMATEDFNDDKKDAGDMGSGHSVTALYELIPANSTEELSKIDARRYGKSETPAAPLEKSEITANELFEVKIRYKDPKEDESKLLRHIQSDEAQAWAMASENFRWSAATAEFGLCLRHSVHAKAANYDQVLEIAHTAIGKDEFGYRKEMIDLVKLAQELDKPVLAATKE